PLWAMLDDAIFDVKRSSTVSTGIVGNTRRSVRTNPRTCWADSDSEPSSWRGSPTTNALTASRDTYDLTYASTSLACTVSNAVAISCNGSVTATPTRLVP